jgi:uncharacterized SAM-binding protein YcdF (DUF218 family)
METSSPAPETKSPWKRRILIALSICSILFLLRTPLLRSLGSPLILSQKPVNADLIIVLAGGKGQRVQYGVQLWQNNFSKSGKILMSGGQLYRDVTWSALMKKYALKLGIPANEIIEQPLSLTTTTDAFESIAIMRKAGFKSALLVTDAFHSRRALRAFNKIKDPNMTFTCSSLPRPKKDWWQDDVQTRYLVSEYLKWIWSR